MSMRRRGVSGRALSNRANVRYPLRRHTQEIALGRPASAAAFRQVQAPTAPEEVNWGARLLIVFAGWICGMTADSLVMFATHHFHIAKNRDPDLFAIVLGTGFAGHAIYAVFAALFVGLVTAFRSRKWIFFLLLGFAGGLASI